MVFKKFSRVIIYGHHIIILYESNNITGYKLQTKKSFFFNQTFAY